MFPEVLAEKICQVKKKLYQARKHLMESIKNSWNLRKTHMGRVSDAHRCSGDAKHTKMVKPIVKAEETEKIKNG